MVCARSITSPTGEPLRADWRRAADGIGLAGMSVFLLLTTMGVLPWSFWIEAIQLWPLLIMSAGIKLAFERTRVPWLVLAGPAIVLAGLTWVATGARPDLPRGPWKSEGPLLLPEGTARTKLDFELFGARLSVEARQLEHGALADARSIERWSDTRLEVDRQEDTARLRLDTSRHGSVTILPGRKQLWDLGVPSELPLSLNIHGAMARSQLDLSRGRFEGGRIDGAFLATQLALPAVAEPVKLVQKGAFNVLRLSVPEGTPVNVRGAGFPLNMVRRRVPGAPGRAGYEVVLDGAFSVVEIDSRRPTLPAEAPPSPVPPEAPSPTVPGARPKPEAEPGKPASPAPVRG
jgi:hypothetical protein